MEKPSTTVSRMLKELEKRNKAVQKKVKQYVKEFEGEDMSMLSAATLVDDFMNEQYGKTYTAGEVRILITRAMSFAAKRGNTLLSFVIDAFLEANNLKESK